MSNFKVLRAEIINFKGIRHRLISFNSKPMYLIGGNGKGKSSVIDAILSCINSKWIPSEPINNQIDTEQEREKGTVRLTIGDQGSEDVYEIFAEYVPSRKSGKVSLTINGEEVKGNLKDKIKQVFGEHSFDIYEFMHASKAEQINTLKKLTGCEPQINALDSQRKEKLEDKLHITKTIEEIQAVNKKENRPFTQEDIRTYEKPYPTPIEAIQKEIDDLKPAIETWERGKKTQRDLLYDISVHQQDYNRKAELHQEKQRQIDRLKAEMEELTQSMSKDIELKDQKQTKLDKINAWFDKNTEPNLTDINNRLNEAINHNKQYDLIKVYRERQEKLFKKQEELTAIEEDIKGIDQQKVDLIANSQLPVKGLTFDEKSVYLDGLPFEQGQINTAKYLEVGAEIAMATNKKLKLVVIREASLFDDKNLHAVLKKIYERGYQTICEVVDRDGGELEIKFEEEDLTGE